VHTHTSPDEQLQIRTHPCATTSLLAAEVKCLITSGSFLLSGSADGCTKLWDLDDGSLLDSKAGPQQSGITALEQIGPLMVCTRVWSMCVGLGMGLGGCACVGLWEWVCAYVHVCVCYAAKLSR
jgi:WD40 repeat protein